MQETQFCVFREVELSQIAITAVQVCHLGEILDALVVGNSSWQYEILCGRNLNGAQNSVLVNVEFALDVVSELLVREVRLVDLYLRFSRRRYREEGEH